MSLNHGYTCPDIDKAIENFKSTVEDHLDDMIEEMSPLIKGQQRKELIQGYVDYIYNDVEEYFEDTRQTNSDLRHSAEAQLQEINEAKYELQQEVMDAQNQIQELEEELENLKLEQHA